MAATCCNVRLHLSPLSLYSRRREGEVYSVTSSVHIWAWSLHAAGNPLTGADEWGGGSEGAAKVYIRRERGSRWCETHGKQITTEDQRRNGIPLIAFLFYILTALDHLLKKRHLEGGWIYNGDLHYLFSPSTSICFSALFLPLERRTSQVHHYVEQYGFERERFFLSSIWELQQFFPGNGKRRAERC